MSTKRLLPPTAPAPPVRQGPRRDRRRRQLRELVRAGRPVLPGRRPRSRYPGLMHVDLGGYHIRDVEFTAAFDIDADKVGKDLSEAIFAGQNNTIRFSDEVPKLGIEVHRGMTHDGLGKYLIGEDHQGPRADRRHRRDPQGHAGRTSSCPICRSAPSRRPSGTSSRSWTPAARSSTASRCSSPASSTGTGASRRPACRSSATTSSPRSGRRSSTAPRPAVPRPRRQAAADLPAQRRRQHGLLQHARARAAGVQEDLEDQRGHLDHGPRRYPPTTSTSVRRTTCRG